MVQLLKAPDVTHYNAALQCHRLFTTDSQGTVDKIFWPCLRHALRLEPETFPSFWQQTVDQLYLKRNTTEKQFKILICFTDQGTGLNVPIPYFHSIAVQLFDGIAYFFDHDLDYYTSKEPLLCAAFNSIKRVAPESQFSFLGTSGGATAALRLSDGFQVVRRISASPPIGQDPQLKERLLQGKLEEFAHSRIFIAASNSMDQKAYWLLQDHLPAHVFSKTVYNLDWHSHSHGTLATVMELGALPGQLSWLAT